MPLTRHRAAFVLLAASLVALVSAPQSHEPPRYAVHDLGTLGGTVSFANGINEHGRVVGFSLLTGDESVRAFAAEDKMRDVGTLGGDRSVATGINDKGQIVGGSLLPNTDMFRAFVRTKDGIADLGTLGGDSSAARGINNSGVIVGAAGVVQNKTAHAFVYENGTMRDISPVADFSTATAINNRNQITGYFLWRERKEWCAFLMQGGSYRILPSLGGRGTFALGLNERGKVVGVSDTAAKDEEHAFVYDNASGKTTDLGTLGGTFSEARSINDAGQIVGIAALPGDDTAHAFLVEPGQATMVDLNTRLQDAHGYEVVTAWGINDAGQIAATGFRGETVHALRLDPVRGSGLKPGAAFLLILTAGMAFVAGGINFQRWYAEFAYARYNIERGN